MSVMSSIALAFHRHSQEGGCGPWDGDANDRSVIRFTEAFHKQRC